MVKLIKTENTNTGWSIDDNGTIIAIEKTGKNKKGGLDLVLPENSENRSYVNLNSAYDGKILEKRTKSSTSQTTKNIDISEYLDDEDKKLYFELIEKANKRKALDIARQVVEDAKKAYEELLKENQVDAE